MKKTKTVYRCQYQFLASLGVFECDVPSVADVIIEGFWVNNNGQFTRGSDCAVFVPAGRIICIKKLEVEETEQ